MKWFLIKEACMILEILFANQLFLQEYLFIEKRLLTFAYGMY